MNELITFTNEMFGEIRTTIIDCEPWFVGKDIANALGYSDTSDALKKHVDGEDKLRRRFTDSGQGREMYIISESGLYSLILSSKLPSAKQFKRWVTSEVLPQIRKTGGYIPVAPQDDDLTIMAKAHKILERTLEQKDIIIENQNKQILSMQPKVDSYDLFIQSDGYVSLNKAAKSLHKGRNKMTAFLRDNGVLFKDGKDNIAYQQYCNNGCFTVNYKIGRDGVIHAVTKVSPKGIVFIKKLYEKVYLCN